jgi:hypothetical protein
MDFASLCFVTSTTVCTYVTNFPCNIVSDIQSKIPYNKHLQKLTSSVKKLGNITRSL